MDSNLELGRIGSLNMRPTLSIIIPLYNEEESLHPLYDAIRTAGEQNGQS